jgi:hypothetical protein
MRRKAAKQSRTNKVHVEDLRKRSLHSVNRVERML